MIHGNGHPFKVVWPGFVLASLQALRERALHYGLSAELLADLRSMRDHLAIDPTRWGDPLFRYHSLGLEMFRALADRCQIHYAVDHIRRIVYVQAIDPLPGRGLDA